MNMYALTVIAATVALAGCKSRDFNTASSMSGGQSSEFELASDPTPDRDFDDPALVVQQDNDFVLQDDARPDSDFL